jgi:biotin transport system substrate-specific component
MTSAAPASLGSSRSLALVALFAALLAVFGLIPKIDLPFGVPITIQTLGVMLAGCLLGPKRAFLSLALFMVALGFGLPLLSGGRGGLAVFVAPSSGFLIGWLFGAVAAGAVMWALPGNSPRLLAVRALVASFVGGVVVVYAFGIAGLVWLAHLSPWQAFVASLAFVPGDLVKCVLCAGLVHTVARGVPDWGFGGRPTA